ncbi:MAG TPA: hypothetical protein ENH10_10630 [Bacteroidetes bacterium]|nr:hypothetical protein [Bacteroidota bacterium]HEX05588.1 hypothetical protein [Bacteroidota bacterium]
MSKRINPGFAESGFSLVPSANRCSRQLRSRFRRTAEDACLSGSANCCHQGAARSNWNQFPFSSRKVILWWIKQAKRQDMREKRIAETVAKAAEGRKAGFPEGKDR